METGARNSRIAVSIGAYFGTSVASFAWLVQRSLPARGNRTWWQLLSDLDTFWERTLNAAALHGPSSIGPADAGAAAPGPGAAPRPTTAAGAAAALWYGSAGDLVSPSEMALFVGINVWLSGLALGALITVSVFLGRLTAAESARLSHRLLRVAVFKMVFLGHVLRGDPRDVALWLAWFAVVAYLRAFGGAAKDRLESLLTAPGVQPSRHVRAVCLLLLVLGYNAVAFGMIVAMFPPAATVPASAASPGAWLSSSRALLAGCDAAVIAIDGTKTLLRYAVHMLDRYRCQRAAAAITAAAAAAAAADDADADGEAAAAALAAAWAAGGAAAAAGGGGGGGGGWSGKGSFLYYVELVADVLMHGVTLAHYMHVWFLHGLSFHLSDAVLFLDMRAVLLSLLRRLRSHLSYRAATHRLNTCFRDVYAPGAGPGAGAKGGDYGVVEGAEGVVAAEGVAAAPLPPHGLDCTICLDAISHVGKQLPCGHCFHLACLRAWLQQSGSESFTCPNCRKPIMVVPGGGAEDGGGRGGAGRGRSWWPLRLLDAAYVRLVVALEPLLLSLLIRLALWLGTRTHTRRRTRAAGGPAPPREGYGESPGPESLLRRRHGRSRRRHGGGAVTSSDVDGREVDSGDDAAMADQTTSGDDHHPGYGRRRGPPDHEFTIYHRETDDGDEDDEEEDGDEEEHEQGGSGDEGEEGDEGEGDEGEGEAEQEESEEVFRTQGWFGEIEVRRSRRYLTRRPRQQQQQRDASDAAAAAARGRQGGLAGWFAGLRRRTTRAGAGVAHEAAAAAGGGGGAGPGPSSLAAAAAAAEAAEAAGAQGYYVDDDDYDPYAYPHDAYPHDDDDDEEEEEEEEEDEEEEAALWEAEAADVVPPLRGGAAAGGRRPRAAAAAAAGRGRGRGRRGLPPPPPLPLLPRAAEEVPTFSGDVLAGQAVAAARRLGASLSGSLRSSWAVGGVCAGAVAGGGGDDHGEVCSRPTPRISTRRRRAAGAAAAGAGTGGGAAAVDGLPGGGRRTRSAARRGAAAE
ncbi:hypothetical protein HXX76_013646 [Chlamydomonas incerta]|uniref:RING-type domain-containing protein n=1 Tax=Chlamydomonas incerta TaxID=51695 RepID=A0A835SRR4_CHLIN|nr:hypothetical protein HXX76_013646 [Chlamydomonas incerta]|eukprot:KAG2425435.1 hypothetical protein HXX76_013646 [Chlamydomonas incerta]